MGTRVYVGRLSYDTRERDLDKFFRNYGRVKEILLKNGFGFVEFEDYRDADDAVYELNGKELLGERVSVEHARGTPRGSDLWRDRSRGYREPPRNRRPQRDNRDSSRYGPPTRTEYRVVVENLSSRVSWQVPLIFRVLLMASFAFKDLKDYMRQAGEVTYADAHKQHRNEGVVEFATLSDMKNAVEKLDDTELNGRRIRLVEDRSNRRKKRSRSPTRSRSRSPSGSRSKSKSRSLSHGRDNGSKSKSRSRSKSRSPTPRRDSRSRSRSRSKSKEKSKSVSRSRSRSRSHSPMDNDRKSPEENGDEN
ncbi:Serine-arginine protein 55 [Nymphon striatum]|nr:Serine-arginine protein 55 [Nymphon striatum]